MIGPAPNFKIESTRVNVDSGSKPTNERHTILTASSNAMQSCGTMNFISSLGMNNNALLGTKNIETSQFLKYVPLATGSHNNDHNVRAQPDGSFQGDGTSNIVNGGSAQNNKADTSCSSLENMHITVKSSNLSNNTMNGTLVEKSALNSSTCNSTSITLNCASNNTMNSTTKNISITNNKMNNNISTSRTFMNTTTNSTTSNSRNTNNTAMNNLTRSIFATSNNINNGKNNNNINNIKSNNTSTRASYRKRKRFEVPFLPPQKRINYGDSNIETKSIISTMEGTDKQSTHSPLPENSQPPSSSQESSAQLCQDTSQEFMFSEDFNEDISECPSPLLKQNDPSQNSTSCKAPDFISALQLSNFRNDSQDFECQFPLNELIKTSIGVDTSDLLVDINSIVVPKQETSQIYSPSNAIEDFIGVITQGFLPGLTENVKSGEMRRNGNSVSAHSISWSRNEDDKGGNTVNLEMKLRIGEHMKEVKLQIMDINDVKTPPVGNDNASELCIKSEEKELKIKLNTLSETSSQNDLLSEHTSEFRNSPKDEMNHIENNNNNVQVTTGAKSSQQTEISPVSKSEMKSTTNSKVKDEIKDPIIVTCFVAEKPNYLPENNEEELSDEPGLTSKDHYEKSNELIFVHSNAGQAKANILSVSSKTIAESVNNDVEILSDEQNFVITQALQGKSFFCTGSAGTGKSMVLRRIIKLISKKYSNEVVCRCAPTGVAAINIGGITLHSLLGINGPGYESQEEMTSKAYSSQKIRSRLVKAKVIIIDEISMLDGDLFDKVEYVIRNVRLRYSSTNPKRLSPLETHGRPFGGLQVILFGDFLQLPPIPRYKDKPVTFAFEANAWKVFDKNCYVLSKVWRQNESKFIATLNEIRYGHYNDEIIQMLRSRVGKKLESNVPGMVATKLFPRKYEVDRENVQELSKIKSQSYKYIATDSGDKFLQSMLHKNCLAGKEIELKVGAQVMLTKNISFKHGLINGTRGVVTDFDEVTQFPIVSFEALHNQCVEQIVEPLQFYVYLGNKSAYRSQLPLTLAWAITCHKSQGLTLSHVQASLDTVFECGQAYVTLSRCQSLEGLSLVRDFDPSCIFANERVVKWMQKKESEMKKHTEEFLKMKPSLIKEVDSSEESECSSETISDDEMECKTESDVKQHKDTLNPFTFAFKQLKIECGKFKEKKKDMKLKIKMENSAL